MLRDVGWVEWVAIVWTMACLVAIGTVFLWGWTAYHSPLLPAMGG